MQKEKIFDLVISNICEVIPELEEHRFKNDDILSELGANSMERAEIIMISMETLSLDISRVDLFGKKTLGELVDVLYDKVQ